MTITQITLVKLLMKIIEDISEASTNPVVQVKLNSAMFLLSRLIDTMSSEKGKQIDIEAKG